MSDRDIARATGAGVSPALIDVFDVPAVQGALGTDVGYIGRATGAGVSTVGAWMRRTRGPTGERAERLAELSAVVERLARVIDPDYIPVWIRKPASALDDEKPLDVLAR